MQNALMLTSRAPLRAAGSARRSDQSKRIDSAAPATMRCSAARLAVYALVLLSGAGAGGAGAPAPVGAPAAQLLPCLDDVLPCTAYLGTDRRPPQTCCAALQRATASDMPCLCRLFAAPEMLATFNVTREQTFGLPARCDLPVGCRAAAPGTAQPVVDAPPPPAVEQPSPAGDSSAGGRCRISGVGRVAALVFLAGVVSISSLI